MKITHYLILASSLFIGGALTSCVGPYDVSASAGTYSNYRPGYVTTRLPSGYRTENYGGTRYFHHNNVYYKRQGSRYVVVERPRQAVPTRRDRDGDGIRNKYDRRPNRPDRNVKVIRRLPNGYREMSHRGKRYYKSGNVYYQSRGNGYVIVPSPF